MRNFTWGCSRLVFLAFILLNCFSLKSLAAQSIVIDQLQQLDNRFALFNTAASERAQTFTVGQTGFLDSIDVSLFTRPSATNDVDFSYSLFSVADNGLPDSSSLTTGSSTVTSGFEGFVTLDFSSLDLAVSPGDRLAIGLSGQLIGWDIGGLNSPNDPYADGSFFYRRLPDATWAENPPSYTSNTDAVFVTRVRTVAVPEPNLSCSLVVFSLLLGVPRRR